MFLVEALIDGIQPFLLGLGMVLIGNGNRLFDDLRLKQFVIAERDIVVLAGQQREDVDIIVARLRPVDQPARAGPLAQGIVNIFRIVGEHAERAIAAHNRCCAGKTFHQNGGHLLLSGGGAVIRALGGHLVDIVHCAKTDGARVQHIVDELLAVLAGLALIGGNLVHAEILVMKAVTGNLAIAVDQARRSSGSGSSCRFPAHHRR